MIRGVSQCGHVLVLNSVRSWDVNRNHDGGSLWSRPRNLRCEHGGFLVFRASRNSMECAMNGKKTCLNHKIGEGYTKGNLERMKRDS